MATINSSIPSPSLPVIGPDGYINPVWYEFFRAFSAAALDSTSIFDFPTATAASGDLFPFSDVSAGNAAKNAALSTIINHADVKHYGAVGDGVADDTAAFVAALATGKSVYVPATSASYKISTTLTMSTEGQKIYGDGNLSVISFVTPTDDCIEITGHNCSVSDLKFTGGYVAGNRCLLITGAKECVLENLDIREFDRFLTWTGGGNHLYITNWHTRNARTYGIELKDGVGCFLDKVFYDTDGTWYGGSKTEPTAFLLINNEGNLVTHCDFIHPGQGVVIETDNRNVEWCLFQDCFISDSSQSGTAGILINQNSNTYYIRGLFFNHVWSATNTRGVTIEGSGLADVDGVHFRNCMIHNNRNEAVALFRGKNIRFTDCTFAGSNAGGGAANTVYTNTSDGEVTLDNCIFRRELRWSTRPWYHIFVDNAAGKTVITNPNFDFNTQNTSDMFIANSQTIISGYDHPNDQFFFNRKINLESSAGIAIDGTDIITDSSGTATLNNIDALDSVTTETVQDVVGAMTTGNTEVGITVAYEDSDGTIDFTVSDTTVAGDTGSTGITPGDTLTIAGGTNATTAMVGDTLTVNVDDAFLLNNGDTGTGVYDFGGASSFEIPNGATPTVDAAGEIAVDTTITNHTGLIKYHDGVEELTVVAMPTANLSSTDGQVVSYNATNDEFEMTTPAQAGALKQIKYNSFTTYTSTSTIIPNDDTIPQNTEGLELTTVTITPGSTTNRLLIVGTVTGAPSAALALTGAIFQDSTADALSATVEWAATASGLDNITVVHEMAAGTTSATTFKLRAGPGSSTFYFNGNVSNRLAGGVARCTLTVYEYANP